ncbi:MAG: DUF177 domain-containing protein [Deltaproteobacteria bacterium]|nr:DUF177 domain-containing protein [Deltaproteobacteria bacterium]
MMRIHTEGFKESSLALEFEQKAEVFPVLQELIRQRECEFTAPIRIHLKAARIGEMVEVEGNLETTLRLTCGRCLTEFLGPLATEFAITYVRQAHGMPTEGAPAEKRVEAEDAGLIGFWGDEIDLTEGIQEQVVLCLPLRPLCREDCKGLCAACGADLNLGECDCRREHPAGPFAALRHLRLGKD